MAVGVAMMVMAVIVWNHPKMLYYNITSAKTVCAQRLPDSHGDGRVQERQRGRWKANSAQGSH